MWDWNSNYPAPAPLPALTRGRVWQLVQRHAASLRGARVPAQALDEVELAAQQRLHALLLAQQRLGSVLQLLVGGLGVAQMVQRSGLWWVGAHS